MKVNYEDLIIAKCEDCGGDALFIIWPAGWTQCGGSQWGAMYQEEGLAWHCPKCWQENNVAPKSVAAKT